MRGSTPRGGTNLLDMIPFKLSTLAHTWFIDLDGTILKHEGLWQDGSDSLLPGVLKFFADLSEQDVVILTTAREGSLREATISGLQRLGITRYDHIIFGLPVGERIVVNDIKDSGLHTAIAWNVVRNRGFLDPEDK